ncbi:MAG: radical SAM family heme chaperone HemW [Chloroflexota bacterium]
MPGLYLHLPFCIRKCAYCDFYSVPGRPELMPAYINALLTEAEKYRGLAFETLYLGGGTPSLIGASGIQKLMTGLRKVFDLSKLTEATIEVNPESATGAFYATAKESGINRISIGVQSLNNSELKSVGRIHTAGQARLAIINAQKTGFTEISCDIIIGLPGQTWGSLRKTLETLLGFSVTHLSLYCLALEEGTPLAKKPPADLPSEDEQAGLFEKAKDFLTASKFVHYEISNFALMGHECLHNLNYWRGGEYLGLGAAAASHLNSKRFKNRSDLDAYIKNPIGQTTNFEELPPKEKAGEEAMLRLRLIQEGLSLDELSLRFGVENTGELKLRLEALAGEGLLIREGPRYRLPSERILTSNQILARVIGD